MDRTTTIVCYDISDPKRLRKVHACCRGYGEHIQYSVFRCELSAQRRAQMVADLDELVHHEEDQVLFVVVGPAEGRARSAFEALGRAHEPRKPGAVVI